MQKQTDPRERRSSRKKESETENWQAAKALAHINQIAMEQAKRPQQ
jgi:hypothetical protein